MSDVVKGGIADADGRLLQGDQILMVNGEDVRHATQEAVAALLKVEVQCHKWLCVTHRRRRRHLQQVFI